MKIDTCDYKRKTLDLLASCMWLLVAGVSVLHTSGCGGESKTPTHIPVRVPIAPLSATVAVGGTQQFTATVQNSSNTAVTWQVNGVTGGNATVGIISGSGLYTGPVAVPNSATVTVPAVSQADSTKSASASVTIAAVAAVSITIAPLS